MDHMAELEQAREAALARKYRHERNMARIAFVLMTIVVILQYIYGQ